MIWYACKNKKLESISDSSFCFHLVKKLWSCRESNPGPEKTNVYVLHAYLILIVGLNKDMSILSLILVAVVSTSLRNTTRPSSRCRHRISTPAEQKCGR